MSTAPTTRLILFGGASLEGDRGPITGRSAQRRRLALLALLAVTRRALSRDKLIGYLWEESDADKARRLLSESVYVIRKSLGEDAVLATGDELRLNPAVVWCDVIEFEEAMRAGDDERAVMRYGGPLLDGFFISDATEFEQWLDRERDRLARECAAALSRLAQKAEQQADYSAAARWWEKLCQHDPYGTVPALGLMRALDAFGDRINALKYARTHARRLRDELGVEPDPQIEAFANDLKVNPLAAPPARLKSVGPESIGAAPPVPSRGEHAQTVSSTTLKPAPPRWPKRVAVALVLLAIATTVIVMQFWPLSQRNGEPAKAASLTLAILPGSAPESAEDVANQVAQLLSTNLDGAGEVRTVDPHRLQTRVASERGPLPPRRAARFAGEFDAQMFVLIDVVKAASQYTITASLYETERPDSVRRVQTVGLLDSLHVMVDDLSRQLLQASGHLPAERLRSVAAMTTPLYAAYKLYLKGDAEFLAGRYDEAVNFFSQATALDPQFALAYYRLSAASEWNFDFQEAREFADSAMLLAERLPKQQVRLIAPWQYFLNGDHREAEAAYSRILVDDKTDVEARAGLAEVLVHYNPVRGAPAEPARSLFNRVLAELPEFGEARFHALEFAARDGDLARFDSIARRISLPNQQQLAWLAVRAFTWGGKAEQAGVLEQLQKADEMIIGLAAGRVASHTHNFDAAGRIAVLLTDSKVKEWKAAGHIFSAQVALAANDWDKAQQELNRATADEEDWTRELKALYLLHPFANASNEQKRAEIERLLRWDPRKKTASTTFFFGAHALVRPELRLYLLGLLSAAVGDTTAAANYSNRLPQTQSEAAVESFARALSQSLKGHIAVAKGQDSTALSLLHRAEVRSPPEFLALSPFYSRAHDRFVIATLEAKRGEREEAVRWYESFLDSFDFVYAAAANRALATLYREAGDTLKAHRHEEAYRRAIRPAS